MTKSFESLLSFCKEYNIDPEIYTQGYKIPRFIRLKNPNEEHDIIPLLQKEFNCKLEPVTWLPKGFFSLPQTISISKCAHYKNGQIYGIDVASAVAVLALNPKPGENILDLCCAPGGKLCYISDKLSVISNEFRITAVDVNMKRLSECKSVLKKYGIINTRLILADGTKFRIVHSSNSGENCEVKRYEKTLKRVLKKIKENSKDKIWFPKDVSDAGILFYETKGLYRQDKMLLQMQNGKSSSNTVSKTGPELFDKILVDAECTTEGSVRHILKCVEENDDFDKRYRDKERINKIVELQKQLIYNGFKQLKPGGILVYSTCSFIRAENEDVVQWLLKQDKTAKLIAPFDHDCGVDLKRVPCKKGYIENTIRFDPITSNTSGLYLRAFVEN